MKHRVLLYLLLIGFFETICAQGYSFVGKVVDEKSKTPIEFVTVGLSDNSLWAVTNKKGEFSINNIPKGKMEIIVSCLGYVRQALQVEFKGDVSGKVIALKEDNLTLDDVVITATRVEDKVATSYKIDRNTLNHMQVLNVADVSQLLPGGKTSTATSLTSASRIVLRSGDARGEMGDPSFGTGVEVDGVRLSTNGGFSGNYGADTRNISPLNIESVEVVTGIPSVEYGDISNGIVKINTRSGKTPTHIEFATNMNNKQVGINKGFALCEQKGVVNLSIDHTTSVSDIASPYTSYKRNNLSLNYSNTFQKNNGERISLRLGVGGNIGGYNSKDDPDSFGESFSKYKDNLLRTNLSVNWLLNKRWITNLSLTASYTQANKQSKVKENKSSSTSLASLHGTHEGYFVSTLYEENPNAPVLITPPGYWYEIMYEDDQPMSFSAHLKADWFKRVGSLSSKMKVGANYSMSRNRGQGVYYEELKFAPSWRAYPYDEVPSLNNLALYAEEQLRYSFSKGTIKLIAGVRADNSYINDSEYGWVSSLSPRFNAKYKTLYNSTAFIRQFSIHAGWGKTVKLPSLNVLYPSPSYMDINTFVAPTTADNVYFTAYYIKPSQRIYNPDLKWQQNQQLEVGVELDTQLAKIALSAYYNRTQNPYTTETIYSPFSYKMTNQTGLEHISIPSANRRYIVNQTTGIVTVEDKTGQLPTQTAHYKEHTRAKSDYYYGNGTPLYRAGIEWVVDFDKIKALHTSIRLDGKGYYYKGVDERTRQGTASSALLMPNGEYYKYIGFYNGGTLVANGRVAKQLQSNLTITTNIPRVRMIVSLRIEGSLYDHSQNLSEYNGAQRGFVLDNRDDYFPSETHTDIYAGNQFIGLYPDYYISFDDMETKIPFAEKFRWAKENDTALFNNLARLVEKSNYNFNFNPSKISAYLSANINVTKEIGDKASVSFYAKNFINNMMLVKDSQRNYEQTLYNSGRIPPFYYGLTLRLKL